ncbi:MAG: protein kinase [Ruminococcaceae bacterium]|nr:protein kinase [Oscillospiraceae bacterium]
MVTSAKDNRPARREAEILQQLEHPAIPQTLHFCSEYGREYLVRENFDGLLLSTYIREEGVCDLDRFYAILGNVCEALQYMEQHDPPVACGKLGVQGVILCEDYQHIRLPDFSYATTYEAHGEAGRKNPMIWLLGSLMLFMLTGSDKEGMLDSAVQNSKLRDLVRRCRSPDKPLRPSTISEVLETVRNALAPELPAAARDLEKPEKEGIVDDRVQEMLPGPSEQVQQEMLFDYLRNADFGHIPGADYEKAREKFIWANHLPHPEGQYAGRRIMSVETAFWMGEDDAFYNEGWCGLDKVFLHRLFTLQQLRYTDERDQHIDKNENRYRAKRHYDITRNRSTYYVMQGEEPAWYTQALLAWAEAHRSTKLPDNVLVVLREPIFVEGPNGGVRFSHTSAFPHGGELRPEEDTRFASREIFPDVWSL